MAFSRSGISATVGTNRFYSVTHQTTNWTVLHSTTLTSTYSLLRAMKPALSVCGISECPRWSSTICHTTQNKSLCLSGTPTKNRLSSLEEKTERSTFGTTQSVARSKRVKTMKMDHLNLYSLTCIILRWLKTYAGSQIAILSLCPPSPR
jgi:hypothetical protein